MNDLKILIIGSDANAYYMARCAYEAYKTKAHLIAKTPWFFTNYSKILTIEYHDDLWDINSFIKYINDFAKKFKNKKILLVASNDTYTEYIAKSANVLAENLYHPHNNPELLSTLQNKELFYKTYEHSQLDFPKTFYYDISKDKKIPNMDFPLIIKPADPIIYNHISFKGKKKIYRIYNQKELDECLNNIKNSGYKSQLIFQEYIEGDDSHMFDSVCYIAKNGEVTHQTFAQVGLQDQTEGAVGNITCLINGYCSFDNAPVEQTKFKLKEFFNSINFYGFADVDLKYDKKSNTFKVLEVNARQGRGSYYMCACGYNLIDIMVRDMINNESFEFKDIKKQQMLTYLPKSVLKNHIKNPKFRDMALKLWKTKVNPVMFKKDNSPKRIYSIWKSQMRYRRNYKNPYWVN